MNPGGYRETGGAFQFQEGQDGAANVRPGYALLESGLLELIGPNEQVDQNEYSEDVALAFGATISGEILQMTLVSTETGTGAVQTPELDVFVFDADPALSTGAAALSAAAWAGVIRVMRVSASEWTSDAGGAAVTIERPVPFHGVSALYFAVRNRSTTSFNDAAGDDEQLRLNVWYRRES